MHPFIFCVTFPVFFYATHAPAPGGGVCSIVIYFIFHCVVCIFCAMRAQVGKYLFLGKEAKQMKSQTGRENLLLILHMAAFVIDSFMSGSHVGCCGRSIMSHSMEKGEGGGVGV